MSDLDELLERWSRFRPDECRAAAAGDPFGYHVRIGGTWWATEQYPAVMPGLVFLAAISAIEAHGWAFSLHVATIRRNLDTNRIVDRGYGATVFLQDEGRYSDGGFGPPVHYAVALLAAYLDALNGNTEPTP